MYNLMAMLGGTWTEFQTMGQWLYQSSLLLALFFLLGTVGLVEKIRIITVLSMWLLMGEEADGP